MNQFEDLEYNHAFFCKLIKYICSNLRLFYQLAKIFFSDEESYAVDVGRLIAEFLKKFSNNLVAFKLKYYP